ncbi:MAG: hypothetical protein QNI87_04830 [Erythrobacter sp.]|uniref:hypothetical protein n=1 Tax=Erythrobacter sp. TaxID=1042 RepID=UPI00261CE825|nr:hypothetical protein [Erythrobacter sp.]MDJ0977840.1 hypothetical protein [Erythrobacter sp.]
MTVSSAAVDVGLHRALNSFAMNARARELVRRLASGGDARIELDPETGLNRYLSAPYPRDILAYSSSTISDISAQAFAHLLEQSASLEARSYDAGLASLRGRIRAAFSLGEGDAQIVFAPSGTDLEYVALACARGRADGGVHNILLGADEIGSGCIHSAHGRFFAGKTALDAATTPGETVPGCGPVSLVDVPVRCAAGRARSSASITDEIAREIERARALGKHCLVHAVHGSKTGLVLPSLSDIDALLERYGPAVTVVVDACQSRIMTPAIHAYLERGCLVLMTGSKFIGAPPFSGWALVPPAAASGATALPGGFARIFRRAEWPEGWPGRGALEDSANLSLALRLTAAIFELERFQAIPVERVAQLIDAFQESVEAHLVSPLGLRRVCPYAEAGSAFAGPVEMRTLITLDVTALPGVESFEDAQALHRDLALDGIRLGQPVKCVRRAGDGRGAWGATLRVGPSMPQMARWARMSEAALATALADDMQRIATAIRGRL